MVRKCKSGETLKRKKSREELVVHWTNQCNSGSRMEVQEDASQKPINLCYLSPGQLRDGDGRYHKWER
jgi:hypothetical protein